MKKCPKIFDQDLKSAQKGMKHSEMPKIERWKTILGRKKNFLKSKRKLRKILRATRNHIWKGVGSLDKQTTRQTNATEWLHSCPLQWEGTTKNADSGRLRVSSSQPPSPTPTIVLTHSATQNAKCQCFGRRFWAGHARMQHKKAVFWKKTSKNPTKNQKPFLSYQIGQQTICSA